MFSARSFLIVALLAATFVWSVEGSVAAPGSTYEVELTGSGSAPVRLHVDEWGEGPPVLLVHGLGMSAYTWRLIAPELAQKHRVIAVDLKGSGRAPKPADDLYGPQDQAELIVRMIEERDLRRVTLVGHSLGGGVCLLTALALREREPRRIERMVIVAGAAYEQRKPPFVRLADYPRISTRLFRTIGARRVVRAVLEQIVHDRAGVGDEQVRGYADPLDSADAVRCLTTNVRQQLVQCFVVARTANAQRLRSTVKERFVAIVNHCRSPAGVDAGRRTRV